MTEITNHAPITDAMYLINQKRDERQTGEGTMGKDDFMKILIAQLQNQDPTNPMQDTEFIAQMAQFSSLEQTMNLTKAFEEFAETQRQSQLIQYNSFLGKNVKWHVVEVDRDGNPLVDDKGKPLVKEGTSVIDGVRFVDGSVVFNMADGQTLSPGNISEVFSTGTGQNSLVEASLLIGKNVTYVAEGEEQQARVLAVSNKNGQVEFVLDNGTKITEGQFIEIKQTA